MNHDDRNDRNDRNDDTSEGFSIREWMETPAAAYNRFAEYEEHIEPLMNALHAECRKRSFPLAVIVVHTQRETSETVSAVGQVLPRELSRMPAEVLTASMAAQGEFDTAVGVQLADIARTKACRARVAAMEKARATTH